jgi:hypothetical protein
VAEHACKVLTLSCAVSQHTHTHTHTPHTRTQGLVNKLTDYGVPEGNILGIRYGFRGFYDKVGCCADKSHVLCCAELL